MRAASKGCHTPKRVFMSKLRLEGKRDASSQTIAASTWSVLTLVVMIIPVSWPLPPLCLVMLKKAATDWEP